MWTTTDNQRQMLHYVITASASLVILFGAITAIAWLCPGLGLHNFSNGFVYDVKYYTALCFIAGGTGLLAALHENKRCSAIMGTLLLFVGLTTIAEYLTGVNLGIDEWLLKDTVTPATETPGRMAPGTATGFICTGLQLLLIFVGRQQNRAHAATMELLGFLVFSLGAEELLAHIKGTADVYAWHNHNHMALQTTIGFMILGIGLLSIAWHRQNIRIARVPLWLPVTLCLLVLLFDIERPRGIGGSIPYVPLVFCSLWFTRPHTAFVFATIATVMSAIAFFVKPNPDYPTWTLILNRVMVVGVVWFVAALIYMRRVDELALQQSEKRLNAIVEHAVDGLISINEQGIIEHFNPACEHIFGYPVQEIIGQNVTMLMPEPYYGEHDGYLSRYRETGMAHIIGAPGREVTAKRKDGSIFPIDISINGFQLDDGWHFSSIVRDITLRKQAEKTNALLAAIVASSEDAIISKDLQGNIISWNTGAEHLFGYSAEEAIGRPISLIIPAERLAEETYITQQFREKKSIDHFETVRLKKNGERLDVSLSVSPLCDTNGKLFGASKILRDITLQRKTQLELLQYTKALEQSNKELDDFAYIASHDLKEPLRGLSSNAQFMIEDYQDKLNEDGVKRMNRMVYLAHRMEQLISDLLYFSRLGRQELAIQSTNLNSVIDDIATMMEITLVEQNASINIPRPLPTVTCDKARITEVFRNLITNAVKYNNNQRKNVEVGYLDAPQTENNDGKQVFYIRDDGIGIDKLFHEDIFRIFRRLNPEDEGKRGSGVGLTFVRKIITRHGGKIWLESEPGKGTTFYFTFTHPSPSDPTQ